MRRPWQASVAGGHGAASARVSAVARMMRLSNFGRRARAAGSRVPTLSTVLLASGYSYRGTVVASRRHTGRAVIADPHRS